LATISQYDESEARLISHELRVAQAIQQSHLPESLPKFGPFELAGFSRSAREVGGDFYDVLALPGERALLVVADVMGKGVPAALFAAKLRTVLRTLTEWIQCPSELLARSNRLLFEELSSVDMFITAQLALLDPAARRLTLANAGHCPLMLSEGGEPARPVGPEGMPLGILPQAVFLEETLALEHSAAAVLYTDGVTETHDPAGRAVGTERLGHWLSQDLLDYRTAMGLRDRLLEQLADFKGLARQTDDVTLLVAHEEMT
jgi:serine phosphatase RsbU (regulator of sigma subunit)